MEKRLPMMLKSKVLKIGISEDVHRDDYYSSKLDGKQRRY
jgi:hypothetical protein